MLGLPRILLSIESSRGFGRDLLTGISNFTRIHNSWTISRKPPFFRNGKAETSDFEAIKSELDGVITRVPEEIPIIQQSGIPAIIATTLVPQSFVLNLNYPTIASDHTAIAQMAVEYFLGQGFKNMAFCGFRDITWSVLRRDAFCDYAHEKSIEVQSYDQPPGCSWDEEVAIIADWLKGLPKPIAILSCSDERGENIIEAAKIAKIRIPEEVAVLGIDDDSLVCNLSNPTLSSIALNASKVGYDAADLLDKLIKGDEVMTGQKLTLLPLFVEVRQSTDILAIDDPEVAQALGFIRQNSREPIQVQDVVNITGISRRVLETRFRKKLNRSILQEIRRIRVKEIAKMACGTNMSIKSIAMSLGFTSIDHISRYFKKEEGISLYKYRIKYGQK